MNEEQPTRRATQPSPAAVFSEVCVGSDAWLGSKLAPAGDGVCSGRSPVSMIQNFATFRSSLPDDSIEADGDIVVPCGRGLMNLIRTAFQHSGYEASEVDQHSHYGWSFDASGSVSCFWLMIQYPEPWLLMIQDSRSIWKRAFSGKAAFERFISRSHSIVQSVSEIDDLRWVTEREWQELSRRTNPKGEQAVHGNTH